MPPLSPAESSVPGSLFASSSLAAQARPALSLRIPFLHASGHGLATCLRWFLLLLAWLPLLASGQTLNVTNDVQTYATLANTTVTMTGKAELHVTGTGDPLTGCIIHLNSTDTWLFLENIAPSTVASTFLSRVQVNGAAAVADTNVRVVQYAMGTVVIPHAATFAPMEVFDGKNFTGASRQLRPYVAYNDAALGSMKSVISSFKLKRGYTATLAQNENGTGVSRNYVAQDGDLEVSLLPSALDNRIRFIRIFPWRWVTKKGSCDYDPAALKAKWHYNWNISLNSARDWEYAAIKHQPYWPSLDQNWQTRGINHLLGYNEPNNPVEDAYKNLTPQGSVSDAVARLPELLGTGLRLGAPAVTDGGYAWIVDFINQAEAAGHRIDYVPVHYYRSYANNNNPSGAATNFYNFLKGLYDAVQRPIWVTEFNNGANWTTDADPTFEQNKNVVEAMVNMMDSTPWIERYAIYSSVEEVRQVAYNAGGLTPMGVMYRDHVAPLSYRQVLPDAGVSSAAYYAFNQDTRDSFANGNEAMIVGTPAFVPGKYGQAIAFDGANDYLQLSTSLGDSTDFTFAGWIKWNGGGNWQRIFDFGADSTHYLFLTPKNGSNSLRFAINTGSGEQVLDTAALPTGVWTHVAVTLSGNTGKLFINGALVATNTSLTYNPVEVGTLYNYLGKSQFAADPLFNGQLDELRFLPSALSDAQITAIANNAPPQFSAHPLAAAAAPVTRQYSTALAPQVSGGNGALTYKKLSGPGWLAMAPNGTMVGVPSVSDIGLNRFLVSVTDSLGSIGTTTVEVNVTEPARLVARYSFESAGRSEVGTAVAEIGGNPYNSNGVQGMAIQLDGTDDYLALPPGTASYPEITIATWFRRENTATWPRLFDFGTGQSENMFLTPKSSASTIRFGIKNGGSEQNLNSPTLPTGQWVHVAVTLGNNVGRLYVNRALVDTQTITIKPTDFRHEYNYLGKSQWPDPFFNGLLDEFLIYNYVLTPAQIADLANAATRAPELYHSPLFHNDATVGQIYEETLASTGYDANPGTTLTFTKVSGPEWLTVSPDGRISGVPPPSDTGMSRFIIRATDPTLLADEGELYIKVQAPPATGLVAQYQFRNHLLNTLNEGAGTPSGSPAYETSLFDLALNFDGTDDLVTLPSDVLPALTDATFAVRMRWDGGAAWQRIFDFGRGTNNYLFLTPNASGGNLRFTIKNGGAEQQLNTAALTIGDWVHVAVTLQGTTGTLYLNGAVAATGTITITPGAVAPTINYLDDSQFAADPLFKGALDDFRIYSRSLSATEVSALAVQPAAVLVPDSSYTAWVAGTAFPSGESGPGADPDHDGLGNAWEYLFGTNPLAATGAVMPTPQLLTGLPGFPSNKTYLTLQVRVRKHRLGTEIVGEGATTVTGLSASTAFVSVFRLGDPIPDGEFEILTYCYEVAVENSPTGAGFMRLRVSWP